MSKTTYDTVSEIEAEGLRALSEALGPAGFARFIQIWERGSGDYTGERAETIGSWTLSDIVSGIERLRAENALLSAHKPYNAPQETES